ncbi:MAG: ABC transporter permease [Deferrisomatales bacterium]
MATPSPFRPTGRALRTGALPAPLAPAFYTGWRLAVLAVAALVAAPLSVVFLSWRAPAWEIWDHLAHTLLADLLVNTFWLVTGVTGGCLLLGVSLAWLTAVHDFPGRRVLDWALLLPLAVPTYVLAFVTLGLLDYAGPVQTGLRAWFGSSRWFPDVRSTGGVVAVLTLALYPYVYLLARDAFATQGRRMLEAAQALGCPPRQAFFRVVLPMARPWIAGGALLVIMEALADFGAVSIFNFDTFTTAIYKAWFGFFSLPAAAQLSSCLVVIVFAILAAEQRLRSRRRFGEARPGPAVDRLRLRGVRRWLATGYALAVLTAAFLVPLGQLALWSWKVLGRELDAGYWELLAHSVALGLGAAVLVGCLALVLAYAGRRHRDRLTQALVQVATLGYALPGTVLAVGIFLPVAAADRALAAAAQALLGRPGAPVLQGTVAVLLLAYAVRFLAAGYKPVDGAMHRVTASVDEAARLLGYRGVRLLARVHLPLVRGGVLTGATLVFVDVMKEMPITLMTRPFGWDTFAVKIFELTSEGEWERAALPALTLLLAGLVPIVLLLRPAGGRSP